MTRERRLPQKRDVQSVLPTQNIFSNHQTPQQSPHSSSTSSTPCQNQPQSPSVSFSTTVLLQNNTTSSSFQIPSSNHQLQYPHQPFTSPTPFQNVCQQSTTLSSSSISNIFQPIQISIYHKKNLINHPHHLLSLLSRINSIQTTILSYFCRHPQHQTPTLS